MAQQRANFTRQAYQKAVVDRTVATMHARRLKAAAEYKEHVIHAERAKTMGTEPMSESSVLKLSKLLNKAMVPIFADPAARCWYKLFQHMDNNKTGNITLDELQAPRPGREMAWVARSVAVRLGGSVHAFCHG